MIATDYIFGKSKPVESGGSLNTENLIFMWDSILSPFEIINSKSLLFDTVSGRQLDTKTTPINEEQAYKFDAGSGRFLDLNLTAPYGDYTLSGLSDFTISFLLRVDALGSGDTNYLFRSGNISRDGYWISMPGGKIDFVTGIRIGTSSGVIIDSTRFQQITIKCRLHKTESPGEAKILIDGVVTDTFAHTRTGNANIVFAHFFNSWVASSNTAVSFKSVMLYDRYITDAEDQDNHSYLKSIHGL